MQHILNTFLTKSGSAEKNIQTPVLQRIKQNLSDAESRHLLIISANNSALEILLQEGIIDLEKCDLIFGSDFPLDNTDSRICQNITKIKDCMELGHNTVLLQLNNLYESLYDMLNQHYTSHGSQQFCT